MPKQVKKKTTKPKRTLRAKGEDHHKCRLTKADVLKIRKMWADNEASIGWMAMHFGVARTTIADICYGRTWKSI